MIAVVEECKNLSALCEAMKMPKEYEELYRDVFVDLDDREDTIGKISSFWLEQNPSWQQLREHLTVLQENEALEINEMMESYNHEGTCIYMYSSSFFSRKSDCLGCAVLLCLLCLFDLACFFFSSFSSLI